MLLRVFSLILLMGCGVSYAGLFGDGQARKQIGDLQQQVQRIESRITGMEETLNSQGLLEIYTQIETLGFEVGQLRGQVEVLSNQNELLQKRQKDFYVDLDNRLRRIEDPDAPIGGGSLDMSLASEIASPNDLVVSPPVTPSAPRQISSTAQVEPAALNEDGAYDQAYSLFRNGDYQNAISQFETFVASYPQSRLTSAAAYWIGNSHYALRNFQQSIDAQNRLIRDYPNSTKVSDAMLNIASSQQEMGQRMAAKTTLEDLIAKHPFSDAAEKAKKRLRTD